MKNNATEAQNDAGNLLSRMAWFSGQYRDMLTLAELKALGRAEETLREFFRRMQEKR